MPYDQWGNWWPDPPTFPNPPIWIPNSQPTSSTSFQANIDYSLAILNKSIELNNKVDALIKRLDSILVKLDQSLSICKDCGHIAGSKYTFCNCACHTH